MTGLLEPLLQTKQAILNKATTPKEGNTKSKTESIQISQYREHSPEYLDDPETIMAYPVFDSLDLNTRQVVGILAVHTYWRLVFGNLFHSDDEARGYICVLSNSYNQTLSYRIDGPKATYLGEGDLHDPEYADLVQEADINDFVQAHASVQSRSFTQVSLNQDIGNYRLSVYPSAETHSMSQTRPWIYTCVVLAVITATSIILIALDRVVAKRQAIVMASLLQSAKDNADHERELNEFMAHEVRK